MEIPDGFGPFLRIPEFVRLRGVRLSNVDSFEFKDFNGPSRWEHAVGVLHLALLCADARGLAQQETVQLALAALLHDVATPPFAHTAEYVLNDFDHERETAVLLSDRSSGDVFPGTAIFESELPQFRETCRLMKRKLGPIDADEVAQMVVGQGPLGFLISGSIDLDNIDNVTRASLFMGIDIDRSIPQRLAVWLATQQYAPILGEIDHPDVRKWLDYRESMYGAFYGSSKEEQGREAFLQHLFRRGVTDGMPRRRLVWNTDEGLLRDLALSRESESNASSRPSLRELVRRYRLLESPHHLVSVEIPDPDHLRALKLPQAAAWMEQQLSTNYFEAVLSVSVRRYMDPSQQLFPPSAGELHLFKLGGPVTFAMLPTWLQNQLPNPSGGKQLTRSISRVLALKLPIWARARPWLMGDARPASRTKELLDDVGDWSFRQSRNESFHVYPGTYVHAIPAALIHALGVKGETILDPFGGTGQTAVEGVKYGCSVYSSDSNSIANLVAGARLAYLAPEIRAYLRNLSLRDILSHDPAQEPNVANLDRWFDPATLMELRHIKSLASSQPEAAATPFLTACFSAILTGVSGRRGKQHGYFADNTPLERGKSTPPYADALCAFLARVSQNLDQLERLYAFIERDGRDPEAELARVRISQSDARSLESGNGNSVGTGTVAAVITSPPYLCMADYALGNRLSYQWLDEDAMSSDYSVEIGARRQRFRPDEALKAYYSDMTAFARESCRVLVPSGYLAMVIGAPVAKRFAQEDILDVVDRKLAGQGLRLMWSRWRDISWHRNHGYARLSSERVCVFVKE